LDITRTAVDDFYTGGGEVSDTPARIVEPKRAPEVYKGVMVRARHTNNGPVYLGPATLRAGGGYKLMPGEEVLVPVSDPSKVYVVGTPGDGVSWLAV
jgi:hypothetical protein